MKEWEHNLTDEVLLLRGKTSLLRIVVKGEQRTFFRRILGFPLETSKDLFETRLPKMNIHSLTVWISLRSKLQFTDSIAQHDKNIDCLSLVSSPSDRAIHCKAQMDVRGVLEGGGGLMGADELLGSWRMIGAAMTRVASTSFFGRTMCIKWAVTWRNKFSTDSPVLAETKYESMSRSLAKRWCFSALTARKCSRSPKQ